MGSIWSKKVIIPTIVIAALYVVAAIYLMNAGLVKDTIFGAHSLSYKWNLLTALLLGMWTAMSRLSLFLLLAVAILTGANAVLVVRRLQTIRASGGVSFVAGGGSLLGIAAAGCASCGLPALAFLGLGGAIGYLPFGGIELSAVAIALLGVSLYVLLKNREQENVCDATPPIIQKT